MARDRTRSVHRIPALAICLPALGLPIVQISHRRGSLIPLPSFEAWETDQIKLQAMGFVVTLKSLRAAVILTNGN